MKIHTIDLHLKDWNIQGWRPFIWQLGTSVETNTQFKHEFGPYPAKVPGSAHAALRMANVIPDWNMGLNSLACEWVEHRHWEFFTDFKAGEISAAGEILLEADGLDYSGWILVDGRIAAEFKGALIRHCINLTRFLNDGLAHRLSVMFDLPPEEQGQIGFTSQTKHFKPRYSFSWDWCVRLVTVGIMGKLFLKCSPLPQPVNIVNVQTMTAQDRKSGELLIRFVNKSSSSREVQVKLQSPGDDLSGTCNTWHFVVPIGEKTFKVRVQKPILWSPNGEGQQYLYDLEVLDSDGLFSIYKRRVGFKHVRWLPCQNAPAGARPLLCEVNGQVIFLQGVNWTPVALDYQSSLESDYRQLVKLYRDMGCNLLRVWGGAFLETELFYQLCDESGLLVWQEFPLSSSGIDNEAPSKQSVLTDLKLIATDYVRRVSHHVSLLIWCGGNELRNIPVKSGQEPRPLDETHPAMAMLGSVVAQENPGIDFLPTSPSGPVFYAWRNEMGKGVHHHVHGPWDKNSLEETWRDYWLNDDSLLRSEVGVAGAAQVELLRQYGCASVWPPNNSNPWWRHSASWWDMWELFQDEISSLPENEQLEKFVQLSQKRQAEFLAIAAAACKNRFPQCAGFFVWMGHDSFPCPANTSIIDYNRNPKPAYHALRKLFNKASYIESDNLEEPTMLLTETGARRVFESMTSSAV